MHFNENLKHYRKKRGFSQQHLAGLTGIPQTTISEWERGVGEATFSRTCLLAEALRIPVAFFSISPERKTSHEQA